MTTASHRRRAPALRAARRRHDWAPSGHAASPAVAAALADAFLTTSWQRETMIVAGYTVLGRRRRWVAPVVTRVLRAYREAPADRPRELAGFIAHDNRRAGHHERARGPRTVIRRRLVAPVRAVRLRWNVPRLDDLVGLADFLGLDGETPDGAMLDWFADRRELNRQARDERLRHYRCRWLPHRLIEAPKPRLKAMQRRLLTEILSLIPVHADVHGFVPGRGVHTFADRHAGQVAVIRLDLRSFFSSVTAARVYGVFRTAGYPEPVAHALTALTTTCTPAAVLRGAPDPTTAALLRRPHLPQGAPTSPVLANLAAYHLDRRLNGLAARFRTTYSRYADDLAFSGALGRDEADRLVTCARRIVADEGFRVHPGKTRIRHAGDRQLLAGLVVNHRPAVPRADYDRLRAILHDAATRGLDAANRDGHPDFAAHLTGRVAWMSHHHPTRAAKLSGLLRAAIG